MDHRELAAELFLSDCNCAQAVLEAFSDVTGLEKSFAAKLASSFGGGMGRMREVCGAFCGVVTVLSMVYADPTDPKDKSRMYALVQQAAEQYRTRNGGGSIICRELLGLQAAEGSPVASPRTPEYYKKRPCPELCRMAADILAEYIAAHPITNRNPSEKRN